MHDRKLNVLFVGSFRSSADDGTVGGQGFACQSLLDSTLSDHVHWHLIDSTQKTQPPPILMMRAVYAAGRVLHAIWLLITGKIDTVLIFSSYLLASFAEKGLIALIAKLFRKRVVLAIRSEVRPLGSDSWANWYRRMVIKACTKVICQNSANVTALKARFGPNENKYAVVQNWLDASVYEKAMAEHEPIGETDSGTAESTTELKSTETVMRFIYLGWLIEDKGLNELLQAAHSLSEQSIRFHLSICGGGDLLDALKQQVHAWNLDQHVVFTGWVTGSEKVSLLHYSDVLILPSYSEGMPNSVLEGMSAGTAVIASQVGGIPDLIRSDAQGLLVPPRDSASLASAMIECVENPQKVKQMGENNRHHVSTYHNLDVVIPQFKSALGLVAS